MRCAPCPAAPYATHLAILPPGTPPIHMATGSSGSSGGVGALLADQNSQQGSSKRGISTYDPLRLFLLSDYPVGQGGSASAERMLQTAHDLSNIGHDVFLLAPSYSENTDIADDARFTWHPILFKPAKDPRWDSGGAPYLGFDFPVLDKSRALPSRNLFSTLNEGTVDQLLMAYSAHLFFARLLYGEPNVVITSHINSPWNFVASNYPLVAFTSDSDVQPKNDSSGIVKIMQEGASRLFRYINFSRVAGGPYKRRYSITPAPTELKNREHRVCLDIDMSLFSHKGKPSKEELKYKFSDELGDVSEYKRWVVLYDRSGQPDIERYLISLAAEMSRTCRNVTCIALQERPGSFQEKSAMRVSRGLRVIDVREDYNKKRMILSAADAALIYIGEEGPPRGQMDRVERDVMIGAKTALVLKSGSSRRKFFPGSMNKTAKDVLSAAYADISANSEDLDRENTNAVLDYLDKLIDDKDTEGVDAKIKEYADLAIAYALRRKATALITKAACEGKVDPEMGIWKSGRDSDIPPSDKKGKPHDIEPLLYEAALKGALNPMVLEASETDYNARRKQRLNSIRPRSETKMAFEALRDDMALLREAQIVPSFKAWQEAVLRGLYTNNLRPSINSNAHHDPREHPSGIVDEMARITGVPRRVIYAAVSSFTQLPPRIVKGPRAHEDSVEEDTPSPPSTVDVVVEKIGGKIGNLLGRKKDKDKE